MTPQATHNQEAIRSIKLRMATGELTYEQAKAEAQPIIDAINAKSAELAKKYHVRAGKVNFSGLVR